MFQKLSEHIDSLIVCEDAIRLQFEMSELELDDEMEGDPDPLLEKQHEVVPGMINKYGNRVLCLLTAECAAYCRFCTRRRLVSDIEHGRIGKPHIDAWTSYLHENPQVREVILSGGDPFIVSDSLFEYAMSRLSSPDSIKVLRIGTRAPVSDPAVVSCAKLETITRVEQPVYVGIHFEHPAEITRATRRCIRELRAAGAILYSQSVFLKGVNDDYGILYELFTSLMEMGVRPYYIYRCDPVSGASHFRVEFEEERRIMSELRRTLSGMACPIYVIDAPDGSGKIPVPLDFWDSDTSSYTDFEGKRHSVD